MGHITWPICMDDYASVVDDIAADGDAEVDDFPLDSWYVAGCKPSAAQWIALEMGTAIEEVSPMSEELAEAGCRRPFLIAIDVGWEWKILRSGVCYHLDFEPSDRQIESGMVPCPE